MTVLITGGTGIIGSTMAEQLLAVDRSVVLFDLVPNLERVGPLQEEHGDRLRIVRGDVVLFGDLGRVIGDHDVEAVVHLAYTLGAESNANPQLASRVNVEGTMNVLELARILDVPRVLMASSIAVYGDDSMYEDSELPLREDAALHVAPGLPVYGAGKLYLEKLCEHYARTYGLVIGGMRPSIVYGWGRRTGATGWMSGIVEGPALGRPAQVGFGEARVSVVYVEDVAAQFVTLLDADPSRFEDQRFFNTGGETCRVRDVAETVRGIVPEADIEVTDTGEAHLYGLAASVSDATMVERFGYRRRYGTLEEGIGAYIEETRAHSDLDPAVVT
jgi:UDP-glucose 4-epimerase